jgi:hypothetical protein
MKADQSIGAKMSQILPIFASTRHKMAPFHKENTDDIDKVAKLITKMDTIDAAYVAATGDELARYQPFLISMLLGDSETLSPEELEEGMKSYFMIWEYFKDSKAVHSRQINPAQFQRILDRNIALLAYMEGEPTAKSKARLVESDLQSLASKALLTGLILRFDTRPALTDMEPRQRYGYLLGMKSLIECFEELQG